MALGITFQTNRLLHHLGAIEILNPILHLTVTFVTDMNGFKAITLMMQGWGQYGVLALILVWRAVGMSGSIIINIFGMKVRIFGSWAKKLRGKAFMRAITLAVALHQTSVLVKMDTMVLTAKPLCVGTVSLIIQW